LTQLRRRSSWLAVAGLVFVCARPADASRGQMPRPPDRFQQWLAAIDVYQPGDVGKIAIDVSTWTGPELEGVIADAKRHARTLAKTDPQRANQILVRGAALHADIARLVPEDNVRRSAAQKTAYVVNDGRWLGIRYISLHWQFGRSLLDSVTPEPSAEPAVRAWYLRTSADLLDMGQFAAALDHYARARQIFPADPDILFASGVLHERFGSTSLQAAAVSVAESNRGSAAVASGRAEIVRAERFYRDSLTHRPDHIEARIRHGRVLDNLGRPDDACEELRRAIAGGASGHLLYLAELFLGRAEEARGNDEAARAAFERASALYPNAQSPRLALSQIARRAGNRAAAQRELHALAELPGDQNRREDPWWLYYDVR
jgi:tetratricopeptide (TPR) repeat protein